MLSASSAGWRTGAARPPGSPCCAAPRRPCSAGCTPGGRGAGWEAGSWPPFASGRSTRCSPFGRGTQTQRHFEPSLHPGVPAPFPCAACDGGPRRRRGRWVPPPLLLFASLWSAPGAPRPSLRASGRGARAGCCGSGALCGRPPRSAPFAPPPQRCVPGAAPFSQSAWAGAWPRGMACDCCGSLGRPGVGCWLSRLGARPCTASRSTSARATPSAVGPGSGAPCGSRRDVLRPLHWRVGTRMPASRLQRGHKWNRSRVFATSGVSLSCEGASSAGRAAPPNAEISASAPRPRPLRCSAARRRWR
mmetsp:Transcript_154290/g.494813  ORF Transcript_154290/g.494813 Transcript_154290/m.494813 type:complete len:304 (+) Transcript_154290:1168-2079(+)